MKRVIVSVINDLSTDQRVHKTCNTIHSLGYEVLLVGRKQRKSLPLKSRRYKTKRMFLLFEKGPLFYMEYQIRLFFYLLFHPSTILVSNDLDTLLPNYLISKLKRNILVYDTHELFCEVPELQSSPFKKRIWKAIERRIFPKLKYVFTVNDSIAGIYKEEYKVEIRVVRNVPLLGYQAGPVKRTKKELGIPENKKIILLQGAGININRGAEEAVQAMQYLDDAVLLIIGGGDVIEFLKRLTQELKLGSKVLFIGKVPFQELREYTQHADLGLTLDKSTNLNYKFSLPNKLFDYIHAGVPVLSSDLPEIKKIIDGYNIGECIDGHDPQGIAKKISTMLHEETIYQLWKKNTKIAAESLNWEKEEQQLVAVYRQFW
ncbi:MAG TPA: glycosyltransferase [Bacteroidia bacterium]|jgi:glycosyltransferase involved in cell wall biosynthesis|nr:glycosyltransferase [Bacteroidia bacterium]